MGCSGRTPLHPRKTSLEGLVWAGGEGGFQEPFFLKSTDGGRSWTQMVPWVGGDNAGYRAAVDPSDSARVLVGMERKTLRTSDDGAHWVNVFPPSPRYFLGLVASSEFPSRFYAVGEIQGPSDADSLTVYVTPDSGDHWAAASNPGVGYLGVRDVLLQEGPEVLYLGTDRGVYRFRIASQ